MNKLILTAIVAFIALTTSAQNFQGKGRQADPMTPEQVAELQTKQLTLDLSLTEAQQKKVHQLYKEMAEKRQEKRKEMMTLKEKGEKPSSDVRYQMQKERLDAQIEHQNKMKKILDEKQFETWKKNNDMKKKEFRGKMKERTPRKNIQKKNNK